MRTLHIWTLELVPHLMTRFVKPTSSYHFLQLTRFSQVRQYMESGAKVVIDPDASYGGMIFPRTPMAKITNDSEMRLLNREFAEDFVKLNGYQHDDVIHAAWLRYKLDSVQVVPGQNPYDGDQPSIDGAFNNESQRYGYPDNEGLGQDDPKDEPVWVRSDSEDGVDKPLLRYLDQQSDNIRPLHTPIPIREKQKESITKKRKYIVIDDDSDYDNIDQGKPQKAGKRTETHKSPNLLRRNARNSDSEEPDFNNSGAEDH